jgi:hypothetical protein
MDLHATTVTAITYGWRHRLASGQNASGDKMRAVGFGH